MIDPDKYRPDIDGLRAVAVICVIVYHLNAEVLIGGYLGVDIFFVISGYLITRLITKSILQDEFSIVSFWKRRINRLMPSILLMLSITLLAGCLLLFGSERLMLCNSATAALSFCSNVFLWLSTDGYWSDSAATMPLLHTWSLSLEEQFYLFFPFFLIVVLKQGSKKVAIVAISITMLTSFWLNWVYGGGDASFVASGASFYLLHTRLWELMLGAFISFLPAYILNRESCASRVISLTGSLVGLIFITVAVVFIGRNDIDGMAVVLACLGSCLLMYFGGQDYLSKFLLSNRAMVYVGKLSYSLYLWHWPVIVFAGYFVLELSGGVLAVLCLLIVVLALVAHYLVEKPMRYGGAKKRFIGLIVLFCTALASGYLIPSRLLIPKELEAIYSEESYHAGFEFNVVKQIEDGDGMHVGHTGAPVSVVLAGSSHAWMYGSVFETHMKESGLHGLVLAISDVGITISERCITRPSTKKILSNKKRTEIILRNKPQCTIIAGLWWIELKNPDFEKNFANQMELIAQASETVLVMGQPPMFQATGDGPSALRRYIRVTGRGNGYQYFEALEEVTKSNDVVERLCLAYENVLFVDSYGLMADGEQLNPYFKGRFLYRDRHHLNYAGADYLYSTMVKPLLSPLLKAR